MVFCYILLEYSYIKKSSDIVRIGYESGGFCWVGLFLCGRKQQPDYIQKLPVNIGPKIRIGRWSIIKSAFECVENIF